MLVVELAVVVGLIVLNGFLAMSELALVSARRPLLEQMARDGSRGAAVALELTREPGRMLSAVQIGITLVGIIAGAFSGATIAERADAWLESQGMPTRIAEPLAFAIVIVTITYLSVVAGELPTTKRRDARRRPATRGYVWEPSRRRSLPWRGGS